MISRRFIGRFQLHAASSRFAVLAHADLHLVFAEIEDRLSSGRMRSGPHRNCERAHVAFHALCHFKAGIQRSAVFRGGASYLIYRQQAHQSAAICRVRAGYVFLRQHHLHFQPFAPGRLHGKVRRQHISGVIQHHQQRALAACAGAGAAPRCTSPLPARRKYLPPRLRPASPCPRIRSAPARDRCPPGSPAAPCPPAWVWRAQWFRLRAALPCRETPDA